MDGTFAGDGPGPRCMTSHVANCILASGDMIAIDAVTAKMMGFDPVSIKFIRLAARGRVGLRPCKRNRNRWRGCLGGEPSFSRSGYACQQRSEDDLLGSSESIGASAPANFFGAMVLRWIVLVSRCLLVQLRGPKKGGAADTL